VVLHANEFQISEINGIKYIKAPIVKGKGVKISNG
jgi:hypothetical protein